MIFLLQIGINLNGYISFYLLVIKYWTNLKCSQMEANWIIFPKYIFIETD